MKTENAFIMYSGEFESDGAELFSLNGQRLFPLIGPSGGLKAVMAFYVWDGNPTDKPLDEVGVRGEILMNDTEENVEKVVRETFAKFRLKQKEKKQ
jgi:hypothetical protein